jgi:natural resistance-associated macrophage protein
MKVVNHEEQLLAPPQALLSRNPLKWVKFFGPGAIVASVTIGSGEVFFSSRGGTIFGYRILWILLAVALLKWILVYSSMRHMILTGGHPFDRWSSLPGPWGWFPLFMFTIFMIGNPAGYSFVAGVLGTACVWIFGVGDLYLWATVFVGVALLFLTLGGYGFLEKAQLCILSIKVGCIVVAVFFLHPDWLKVFSGAFLPHSLSYPDWLFITLPEMRNRSVWVEVLVYVSAIGGGGFDYIAYVSFLRDKQWGWSHVGLVNQEQLERTATQKDHPARLWLRAAMIDTIASFAMVVIISSCFAILGAMILSPQHLVPEGMNLLNYQASFLTALASWLLPVYKVGIFFAFFGCICGAPALNYQVFYEYCNSLPRWRGQLSPQKLRAFFYAWYVGGGLVILWASRLFPGVQLLDIFTPVGIYTSVMACGFYCLMNPWTDWHFLPRSLRMSVGLMALNFLAGAAFLATGLKALWDFGQYRSCLMLPATILLCIWLARRLRFLGHTSILTEQRVT